MSQRPIIGSRFVPTWLGKQAFHKGFNLNKFSALKSANGFTEWHFMGLGNSMAELLQPGFFGGAAPLVSLIDHVNLSARDATGLASFHLVGGELTAILMVSSPRLPADLAVFEAALPEAV